jgi:hypothetical protein
MILGQQNDSGPYYLSLRMMRCYGGMWPWASQLLGVVISVRYPRCPGGIQCDHISKQNSCQDGETIRQRRLSQEFSHSGGLHNQKR